MEEYSTGANNCFICGRDLGPEFEWMKMQTERGPICYVCFNQVTHAPLPESIEGESKN